MAFKNEDLAIHLSEQFEQDVWAEYALEMMREHETHNAQARDYARQPTSKVKARRWEDENADRRAAQHKARYERETEKCLEKTAQWKAEHPERVRELQRESYSRRLADPVFREKERLRKKAYNDKKSAERLAAQQAVSPASP